MVLAALGAVAFVVGAWQHSTALGLSATGIGLVIAGVGIHFWNRMCDEQAEAARMAQQNPNNRE